MELDIKDMKQQDMAQLVHSLELVSARVLDSVVKTNQLASSYTPEMQLLFREWAGCLGDAVVAEFEKSGSLEPEKTAKEIGVSPSTIISLALTLQREGRIKITEIKGTTTASGNTEICGCMKG